MLLLINKMAGIRGKASKFYNLFLKFRGVLLNHHLNIFIVLVFLKFGGAIPIGGGGGERNCYPCPYLWQILVYEPYYFQNTFRSFDTRYLNILYEPHYFQNTFRSFYTIRTYMYIQRILYKLYAYICTYDNKIYIAWKIFRYIIMEKYFSLA